VNELPSSVSNVVLLLAGAGAVGLAGMWVRRRLVRSRWRFAADGMVLAVVALALAGVAAELAARTLFAVPAVTTHSQYAEYRPGWFALRPAQRWVAASPGWHNYEVRINEDGLRTDLDRPSAVVPPDERRVLFLGDSWTFGIGLDLAETYPVQAEALLRGQDPSRHWVALNAGIPGANVFTIVEWFAWIAPLYRPQVAVFTVGEADDILPDLNTELRRRERYPKAYLTRFALYRATRIAFAWLRYLDERAVADRILAGHLPEQREEQLARLAESAALMEQTASRIGCAVVFNRIVFRSPRDGAIGASPEPDSFLRPYAEAGAQFVVTVWDPNERALMIPNDGHPTPAGAQLLARVVIPAIREVAAP
jgi:lysophospholipase L1-like esterase